MKIFKEGHIERQRLDGLVHQKLLAKETAKRKIAVTAQHDSEVTANFSSVTEQQIEDAYDANQGKFTGEEAQITPVGPRYLCSRRLHGDSFVLIFAEALSANVNETLRPMV